MAGERIAAPFTRTGRFLAQSAREIGEQLPNPPGFLFSDNSAQQTTLLKFRHRFGLVGNVLEETNPEAAERRLGVVALSTIEQELADSDTMLEIRAIMSEEDWWDPDTTSRGQTYIDMLAEKLCDNHKVCAIANSSPIMPCYGMDTPVEPRHFWGVVTGELEGLDHQMRRDKTKGKFAMLALTKESYARKFFGRQSIYEEFPLREDVLVLRHVGKTPDDNWLLPPRFIASTKVSTSPAQESQVAYAGLS